MLLAADVGIPGWQPHPEVWLLVASIAALGVYAAKVIGPKAVRGGGPAVTHRQVGFFVLALVLLEFASDWPLHDVAESRLYLAHMMQHTLITLVVPPLLLLATPTWLARLIVGNGWFAGRAIRWLARPVVAGVLFNAVIVFSHWQNTVNTSVRVAPVHFGVHLILFLSALLMWTPVCGPLPELRISLPAQMIYLFLMSVIPTIPAAWLTFAEGVVYEAYDVPDRMFGISAVTDQQLAGLFMKLVAGFYLWTLIAVLFFKWSSRHDEADRHGRTVTEHEVLTWDDVRAELARLGPAPQEPVPPQQ